MSPAKAKPVKARQVDAGAANRSAARLSRLLDLVPWLVAHDGVTIAEAAAHFGVSEKQLQDDLWLLIVTGLPGHQPDQLVDIQFWDETGHVHVLDPQTIGRPMRLSPDEAMALLVALRYLAQVPGDHDRAALQSVMAKLEAAAGEAAAGAAQVTVALDVPEGVADTVERAVRENRVVRLRYLSPARDEVTDRDVDPIAVLAVEGRTYLQGWCRLAEERRTFRLDRVLSAEVLDEAAALPAGAQPSLDSDRGLRPDGPPAVLEVEPAAQWVVDQMAVDSVEELPDGRLRITAPVSDPRWAVRLALRLGGALRVVEPPELAEAVRAAAAEALAGYGEPLPGRD
ncbi:MAG: WYL domain-containing protein [Actinomycetota bacterium]|nr:MAG: WYL domain-containing protein [Actinomycetota bacterium]